MPPKCGARGGKQVHSIWSFASSAVISWLMLDVAENSFCSSVGAPWKCVPLLLKTILRNPRSAVNLRNAAKKPVMVRSYKDPYKNEALLAA